MTISQPFGVLAKSSAHEPHKRRRHTPPTLQTLEPRVLLTGTVEGVVFDDLNRDTVRDAGEPGVADVVVFIDENNNGELEAGEPTETTDANGLYSFANVPAGDVVIRQVVPAGFSQTAPPFTPIGTGDIAFVERLTDGQDGVDALNTLTSVAVSPDDAHVYATGEADSDIAVFSRDAGTGELTQVQVIKSADAGFASFPFPEHVSVSPDGGSVYVLSRGTSSNGTDSRLHVFDRDAGTGELTFVESHVQTDAGFAGLKFATRLVYSPDSESVVILNDHSNSVTVLDRDTASGAVTSVQDFIDDDINPGSVNDIPGSTRLVGLGAPNSAAFAPDGLKFYLPGNADSVLFVFDRDAGTGELTLDTTIQEGVDGVTNLAFPEHLLISPDGAHVYTISSSDDSVVVFDRDAGTGDLSFNASFVDGVGGFIQPGHRAFAITGDGQSIIAHEFDQIVVYDRDPATGALSFAEAFADPTKSSPIAGATLIDGLFSVRRAASTSDGATVYVPGEERDTLNVFSHNGATSELALIQQVQDGDGGVDGLSGAVASVVSPDGKHVYTLGHVDEGIAIFDRDSATSELTFNDVIKQTDAGVEGLAQPSGLAMSADGLDVYVYASAFNFDTIAVFRRDPATGALAFVQLIEDGANGVDGLDGVADVAASPDGSHVYAVGRQDSSLLIFDRDAGTGVLTFSTRLQQGAPGIDGIDFPNSVEVSADNRFVYTVAENQRAVGVFSRDAGSGDLTFVQNFIDVPNLGVARNLVISPDQRRIYTGSGQRLTVLDRDPGSGQVSFAQLVFRQNGSTSFSRNLAVTSDGTQLLASGGGGGQVMIFDIDPQTGQLTFDRAITSAEAPGLSPSSSTTAADGRSVYVTGNTSVSVFTRDGGAALPGGQTATVNDNQTTSNVDFGIAGASISGTVFNDLNDNGVLDAGEPGMPGVTVFLDTDNDDEVDPGEPTMVTDANGGYLFNGVVPGLFRVRQVTPVDFSQTAPSTEFNPAGELTFVEQVFDGRGGIDGLNRPVDVVTSPDGAHVYVAGTNNDSVAVFERDDQTELLTQIQVVRDNVDGVTGLDGSFRLLISPDGANVYAFGTQPTFLPLSVVVFERDAGTGELTFVQELTDIDGNDFDNVSAVAMSPDGEHLYVAASASDKLAVLSRDDADQGRLTVSQVLRDGENGITDLTIVSAVAVSGDGAHVYVLNDEQAGALTIYQRDAQTGALTFQEVLRQGENGIDVLDRPNNMVFGGSGEFLYIIGELNPRHAVFSRDPATGSLTLEQSLDAAFSSQEGAISADGTRLYAAHFFDGFSVFDIDPVTGELTFDETIDFADDADLALGIAAGTGDAFYLPHTSDKLTVYSDTGDSPQIIQTFQDGDGGDDGLSIPQDLAISPDGAFVYVASTGEDSVATYARDPLTNELTFVQVLRDGENGIDGLNSAQAVAVSPDGLHAYVTAFGEMAIFSRDTVTGELTLVQTLTQNVGGVTGLGAGRKVRISPDGAHVYVASESDDGIAVFDRDAGTGELTFVEIVEDGVNGVETLDRIRSISISPDGDHVYAVSGDDAITVFSRNDITGELTLVEALSEGGTGIETLDNPLSVAVSPNGNHVVVGGSSFRNLASFTRDPSTGQLTFIEELTRINDSLNGNTEVVFSPDGFNLYVSASSASAVSMLQFDRETGSMTLAQTLRDNEGGVDGLASSVDSVAITPDGTGVYAIGTTEDSLVVFTRDPGEGLPGAHSVVVTEGQAITDLNFGNTTPTVLVTAPDPDAAETGPDGGRFRLTRTGPTTDPMTINLMTGGTATASDDFAALPQQVVIPANESFIDVEVNPVTDDLTEGDETVTLTVLAGDYVVGAPDTATVTIADGVIIVPADDRGRVTYMDSENNEVTVSYRGDGELGVRMTADGVGDALAYVVTGSNDRDSLSVTVRGGTGITRVGDVEIDGAINQVKLDKVDLLGDLTTTGPAKQVRFNDVADDHNIFIGDDGADERDSVTFVFKKVTDLIITSLITIKSITASSWIDTNPTTVKDRVEGPSVGKINIKGDRGTNDPGMFQASLDLDGSDGARFILGNSNFAGPVDGVVFDVNGPVGSLNFRDNVTDAWFIFDDGATRIKAGDMLEVEIDGGDFGSIQANDITGISPGRAWNVDSIKQLQARRNTRTGSTGVIDDVVINATGSSNPRVRDVIGQLKADGGSNDLEVNATGSASIIDLRGVIDELDLAFTGAVKNLKLGDVGPGSTANVSAGSTGNVQAVRWMDGEAVFEDVRNFKVNGDRRSDTPGDSGVNVTVNANGTSTARSALNGASIRDEATGNWDVNGSTGNLTFGAVAAAFHAVFSGDVRGLTSKSFFDGLAAANSFNNVNIKTTMTGARIITAPGPGGGPHVINTLRVGGAVTGGTQVYAGVDSVDGIFDNGDDMFIPGADAAIRNVTIGPAPTSDDVVFQAPAFTGNIRVDGDRIDVTTDTTGRFIITPV